MSVQDRIKGFFSLEEQYKAALNEKNYAFFRDAVEGYLMSIWFEDFSGILHFLKGAEAYPLISTALYFGRRKVFDWVLDLNRLNLSFVKTLVDIKDAFFKVASESKHYFPILKELIKNPDQYRADLGTDENYTFENWVGDFVISRCATHLDTIESFMGNFNDVELRQLAKYLPDIKDKSIKEIRKRTTQYIQGELKSGDEKEDKEYANTITIENLVDGLLTQFHESNLSFEEILEKAESHFSTIPSDLRKVWAYVVTPMAKITSPSGRYLSEAVHFSYPSLISFNNPVENFPAAKKLIKLQNHISSMLVNGILPTKDFERVSDTFDKLIKKVRSGIDHHYEKTIQNSNNFYLLCTMGMDPNGEEEDDEDGGDDEDNEDDDVPIRFPTPQPPNEEEDEFSDPESSENEWSEGDPEEDAPEEESVEDSENASEDGSDGDFDEDRMSILANLNIDEDERDIPANFLPDQGLTFENQFGEPEDFVEETISPFMYRGTVLTIVPQAQMTNRNTDHPQAGSIYDFYDEMYILGYRLMKFKLTGVFDPEGTLYDYDTTTPLISKEREELVICFDVRVNRREHPEEFRFNTIARYLYLNIREYSNEKYYSKFWGDLKVPYPTRPNPQDVLNIFYETEIAFPIFPENQYRSNFRYPIEFYQALKEGDFFFPRCFCDLLQYGPFELELGICDKLLSRIFAEVPVEFLTHEEWQRLFENRGGRNFRGDEFLLNSDLGFDKAKYDLIDSLNLRADEDYYAERDDHRIMIGLYNSWLLYKNNPQSPTTKGFFRGWAAEIYSRMFKPDEIEPEEDSDFEEEEEEEEEGEDDSDEDD